MDDPRNRGGGNQSILRKIGIITVREHTTDYLVQTMVQILGEPLHNFSHLFRLVKREFVRYQESQKVLQALSFKELADLISDIRPIILVLLTDELGLWLPISSNGASDKSLEFLPLVITRIKPENIVIIDVDTKNFHKYKLDDGETLAYYEHIIRELDKTEIHFYARKWCNYLEYKNRVNRMGDKKTKMETPQPLKMIQFAETWLTTKICTESSTQNKNAGTELISNKTHNNIKEFNEELITLKEKNILKPIIDIQQVTETLKTLNTRYDLILKIGDLISDQVQEGKLLEGDLTKKIKERQYKNDDTLRKSFFGWSCYCGAQGLNLLIHGYTRIKLEKYAEGLQFISNGVDHVKYGLFLSQFCIMDDLRVFKQTEINMRPNRISFRVLNLDCLLSYFKSSQNDASSEGPFKPSETLHDIDNKVKSLRNKSVYSHGLAPVTLKTGEIEDIKRAIQNLLRDFDLSINCAFQRLKASLEDSLKNRTDEEEDRIMADLDLIKNFYDILKELGLGKVELNLNEEINIVELLKRFLCYSCIEKAHTHSQS
ncbi:MAG: hypothetical protein ACUVXA_05665 [Candidatus Jordarchaeum sp.]|uniref:hypothetical protein n=1 Tax=Candidatus Jordarchaeum sp. TaxID=2823881 RepID=UPI004049E82B